MAAALAGAGCGGKASEETCGQVAEHMLDVFTNPSGAEPPAGPAGAALEQARKGYREKAPARQRLVDHCKSHYTDDQASCILSSTDEASLAKCGP